MSINNFKPLIDGENIRKITDEELVLLFKEAQQSIKEREQLRLRIIRMESELERLQTLYQDGHPDKVPLTALRTAMVIRNMKVLIVDDAVAVVNSKGISLDEGIYALETRKNDS